MPRFYSLVKTCYAIFYAIYLIKEGNDLEVSEYPYSDGKVSIPSSIHKSNLDKMQKYIEMNIKS